MRAPDAGLALVWPEVPHPPVVLGSESERDHMHGCHNNPDLVIIVYTAVIGHSDVVDVNDDPVGAVI